MSDIGLVVDKSDFADNAAINHSYTVTKAGTYYLQMHAQKKSSIAGNIQISKNNVAIYKLQSNQYQYAMNGSMFAQLAVGDVIKFETSYPVDANWSRGVQVALIR